MSSISAINHKSGKVFVVGHDSRSFLSVIRSLGRHGLIVHVGAYFQEDVALYSKYIVKIHNIPSPDNVNEWKKKIQEILKSEHFDLIIPTNDPNIILFEKFKGDFEKYGTIYLLNELSFKITNNKMATYELARSLGVNVPKSNIVFNKEEALNLLKDYNFPLILKPISSFDEHDLQHKQYVRKASDKEEFMKLLEELLPRSEIVLQECFYGVGVGLELLAHEGDILTCFQHVRVHEPKGGGGSSYRKSIPISEDLYQASKKIISKLQYTGVAMLEYRVDYKNKKWVLIEINGRFWGSLPLSIASGIDFPYYLYQMIVEGKRKFPKEYRKGIYSRNTANDLIWIKDNLRQDALTSFIELKNIMFLKERNDTLVLDDPVPGIMEIYTIIRYLYLGTKIKVLEVPLFRYILRKRLETQLSTSKSILFVCKGNICRSPFAEQYAQKILPSQVSIESCGYFPQNNRESPSEAISVAKSLGIDLTKHRSKILNEDILEKFDIIFVFDRENMQELIKRYPSQKRKLRYLSEINSKKSLIIPDPFGRDESEFYRVYSNIIDCINNIRDTLKINKIIKGKSI